MILRLSFIAITLLLAGCEIPGLGPDPRIAQREAEAKAIGSACRYGLRGIENCYDLYEGASKAAIFEGWKEMDEYMRENKIVGIRAAAEPAPPPAPETVESSKPPAGSRDKEAAAKPAPKTATR